MSSIKSIGTEQFQKDKINTVYERITTTVDGTTGELIEQTIESVKTTQKEPNFVKIYVDTILTFKGIKNISSDFLLSMCRYISYANDDKKQMQIIFNKIIKQQLADDCKISIDMVNKNIKKCVNAGILFKTEYRGFYIVNAFLFARGEWKNIKSLQAEFDFISGHWKYTKKYEHQAEEKEIRAKGKENVEDQQPIDGQTTIEGVA